MRIGRIASALLVAGLLGGTLAALGLAVGWEPRLSPFMLRLIFYKLAFAGAAGLLIAGAVLRRRGNERDRRERTSIDA